MLRTEWQIDPAEVLDVLEPMSSTLPAFVADRLGQFRGEPFRGKFHRWEKLESHPKPVQKPGVPIVVGGHTELAARRAAGTVPPFERVVIETTGLADPAPILHTLMTDPLLAARYRMDGVIVTVDAVAIADAARELDPKKRSGIISRTRAA